jgi:hypothetical protein
LHVGHAALCPTYGYDVGYPDNVGHGFAFAQPTLMAKA